VLLHARSFEQKQIIQFDDHRCSFVFEVLHIGKKIKINEYRKKSSSFPYYSKIILIAEVEPDFIN